MDASPKLYRLAVKDILWIKAKVIMSKFLAPAVPDWCCHAGINQKRKKKKVWRNIKLVKSVDKEALVYSY